MDNGSKLEVQPKTHLLRFKGLYVNILFELNLQNYKSKEEVEERCRKQVAAELEAQPQKLLNKPYTAQQIVDSLTFEWTPIAHAC